MIILLKIPFMGVMMLVDNIRGGVRGAENEKRRIIESVAQATAEISMAGAWAPDSRY